jgi:hypothetical protein
MKIIKVMKVKLKDGGLGDEMNGSATEQPTYAYCAFCICEDPL